MRPQGHPTAIILLATLLAAWLHAALPACAEETAARANAEGVALFKAGRLEEACARFEEALAAAPGDPAVKANLVICLNDLAVTRAREGAPRDAAFWFEKLRDLDPADGGPLLSYANLLLDLGENERAVGALSDALAKELPEEARRDARSALGVAYFKLGRFDDAAGTLEQLLADHPDAPGAAVALATSYQRLGKLGPCVELLRGELERRPGGADAEAMRKLLAKTEKELAVEGDFSSERSARFLIQFEGGRTDDLVPAVREALEEAAREAGGTLGLYPEGQLPVIIYTGEQFRRAADRPGWVAAVYDGKMRLPVGDVTASPERLRAAVRHEYTHVVIHQAANGKCPTWLNEGLAQIMEGRVESEAEGTVRRAAEAKRIPPLATLEGSFMGLSDEAAALAYDLSFLVTTRIVERDGYATLRDLFERMRHEAKTPRQVIEEGLYRSYDALVEAALDGLD